MQDKVYNNGLINSLVHKADPMMPVTVLTPKKENQFLVKAQYQTFYRQLPWHTNVCVAGSNCWCNPQIDIYCWTSNRDGQPNGWGVDDNSQSVSEPWSVGGSNVTFWKIGERHHAAN